MAGSTVRFQVDLDEEALRDRIIEVITGHAVVKPGETLVIRSATWTPDQAEQYQAYMNSAHANLPFRVLVVLGDGLAVAKPFGTHADEALAAVAPADPFADKAAQRGG